MFDRIERGRLIPAQSAEGVSFWTRAHSAQPSLLLRCRDEYQTLPNVSRLLGHGWSSNANVLTPDHYATSTKVGNEFRAG